MEPMLSVGKLMAAARRGGGAAPVVVFDSAFAADGMNQPWYIATTPTAQKFADLGTAGKTIVLWQAYSPGYREVHAKAYDRATKKWSAKYYVGTDNTTGDDHGVVSYCRDNDGYFWCAGFVHAGNLRVFRSNSPNDITAWTEQSTVNGTYTYAHLNNVGGKIYLFLRDGQVSLGQTLVMYSATPSAGSITWGSPTTIGDFGTGGSGSRWYQGTNIIRGTDIWMCATKADAADTIRQHVYILVFNTLDGSWRNISSTTTVAAGSLPMNTATLDAGFRRVTTTGDTGNIPQMCFDIFDDLHIAYMDGSLGSAFTIYHKMYSAASGYVTPTTPFAVAQTDSNDDLHRYDGYTVAPQGTGIDFYTVSAAGLGATRGGNISLAHRDSGGNWTGPSVIRAPEAQGALTFMLDVPVMVRDGGDDFNAIMAEIGYIVTLGVAGTESVIGRMFAYGNASSGTPAAPFIGTPYGPDVQEYVAKLASTPSAAVQAALQEFAENLRESNSAEVWRTSLGIWLPCMPVATDALVNFRSPRWPLTKNGSPVFENPGYRNVAGAYFDVGIGFSTRFLGTSFHWSALIKPNGSATSVLGTASATDLVTEWDGTTAKCRIGGSETALSQAFSATIGVVAGSRTGTTVKVFGNGVPLGSKTATNVALSANNLTWGQRFAAQSLHTYYAQSLGFYMSDAATATLAAAKKTLVNSLAGGIVP